jgi:hypothetical protein
MEVRGSFMLRPLFFRRKGSRCQMYKMSGCCAEEKIIRFFKEELFISVVYSVIYNHTTANYKIMS